MRPQVIDLNMLISNLQKMFHRLIREDVHLRVVPEEKLPPVFADPGMLEQVITNLVVNARDALPKGGEIQICTKAVYVNPVQAGQHPNAKAGRFVRLTVHDSGIGIPTELLPRIFDPFFTTKPAGKGTGLGLATVHGIAEQHGGWVEVQSTVGEGTEFCIYLPVHSERPEQVGDRDTQQPLPSGTETILLVEDEVSLRLLMATVLGKLGYKVLESSSGTEALEAWEKHRDTIDLVLSDVIMPGGISGRALVEKIREERPGIKTMLSTGYESELMDLAWAEANGIHFLQKPFKPQALAVAVRNALDTAR